MTQAHHGPLSFRNIRTWDGAQSRAFEELCYQLHDPVPAGAEVTKTGDPDAGLEWYFTLPDQSQWGWQAKYVFDADHLLPQMRQSFERVVDRRPEVVELTFCVPFDPPEGIPAPGRRVRPAAQRIREAFARWQEEIPGGDRVTLRLETAGQLLAKLALPEHLGRRWFWWHEAAFTTDWLIEQLRIAKNVAGERYTPAAHVPVQIESDLDGLLSNERFWAAFAEVRSPALRSAASWLRLTDDAGESQLRLQDAAGRLMAAYTKSSYGPAEAVPAEELRSVVHEALDAAREVAFELREPDGESDAERARREAVRHRASQAWRSFSDLAEFVSSNSFGAMVSRLCFIEGEAGQGKTHLLLDAAERALNMGQPVVVLFAERFPDLPVWAGIGLQLGFAGISANELYGAFEAAAEATGKRCVLLIDGLNEAGRPEMWRTELPALAADVHQRPMLALACTCRSVYLPIVTPGRLPELFVVSSHPGLAGSEESAIEAYFSLYGLEQPRLPLLAPEFTNPLFLKLYCEGLQGIELPRDSPVDVTTVFGRYIEARARTINDRLHLDPADSIPQEAVKLLASLMDLAGRDWLPRDVAKDAVEALTPHLRAWPDTLFGALRSAGILVDVPSYGSEGDAQMHVRLNYQRFSDYLICGSALDRTQAGRTDRVTTETSEWLRGASPGLWEAASVLLPERVGIELSDAIADWTPATTYLAQHAFVRSLASRSATSIGDRTIALLNDALRRSGLAEEALDALIQLAPLPEHPLNGERLHRFLMRIPMPDRDAFWSRLVYDRFEDPAWAAMRLIRWACRGIDVAVEDDVVFQSAFPLIWLTTLPNRAARDTATKAVSELLKNRLGVAMRLVDAFHRVDDPYVLERMFAAAYGALLRSQASVHDALGLAEAVNRSMLTRAPHGVLARHYSRAIAERAAYVGAEVDEILRNLRPPYGAPAPGNPPTEDRLRRELDEGSRTQPGWGSILLSVMTFGDFGRYEVEPAVDQFSRFRLSEPAPTSRNPPRDPESAVSPADRERLRQLLEGLDPEALERLRSASAKRARSGTRQVRTYEFPKAVAQRWIVNRCRSLGWTPERFGEFDRYYIDRGDRGAPTRERFGKKYQWIALHELVGRIADNYHMLPDWGDAPRTYNGPWQVRMLDVDPTLPPTADFGFVAMERPNPVNDSWWLPQEPMFDERPSAEWREDLTDFPAINELLRRPDGTGDIWVPLAAHTSWHEVLEEDADDRQPRRTQWHMNYAWLVERPRVPEVLAYLSTRGLGGRWAAEGPRLTNEVFFGDIWWAPWLEVEAWQEIGWEEENVPRVHPLAGEYTWERELDKSIRESVTLPIPHPTLVQTLGMEWDRSSPSWVRNGEEVMRSVSAGDWGKGGTALLAREDFLRAVIGELDVSIVFGILGERQVLYEQGVWTTFGALSTLDSSGWEFGQLHREA